MSYKRLVINGVEYKLFEEIFVATYGGTTNAEMWTAFEEGKKILCYDAATNSFFVAYSITQTKVQFSGYSAKSGELVSWICENDIWSANAITVAADVVIEINNESEKNPEDLTKASIIFDPAAVKNAMAKIDAGGIVNVRVKGSLYIGENGPYKMNPAVTFVYGNVYWLSVSFNLMGTNGLVSAMINFTYNNGTPNVFGFYVGGNEITV